MSALLLIATNDKQHFTFITMSLRQNLFVAFTPIVQLQKIETESNLRSWYDLVSNYHWRRQVRDPIFFLFKATNGSQLKLMGSVM